MDSQNSVRCIWDQAVEPNREPIILSPNHKLCQQIRDHLFGDAKVHSNVAKAHVTSDQVIAYLQMSHISKLRSIGRNMETSHGISVKPIWLWAREAQECKHIFRME
jgi:hypothetical protein